jgi:hypothetical protein
MSLNFMGLMEMRIPGRVGIAVKLDPATAAAERPAAEHASDSAEEPFAFRTAYVVRAAFRASTLAAWLGVVCGIPHTTGNKNITRD